MVIVNIDILSIEFKSVFELLSVDSHVFVKETLGSSEIRRCTIIGIDLLIGRDGGPIYDSTLQLYLEVPLCIAILYSYIEFNFCLFIQENFFAQ